MLIPVVLCICVTPYYCFIVASGHSCIRKDGRQGLIFDEKKIIMPVDHHIGHKVGPIVLILVKIIANLKYKYMPYERSAEIGNSIWPPRDFFRLIFTVNMTHLPLHHHGDYRISPIVCILLCITTCHMDEVWLKSEIQNGHQEAV
jgi:hypothetical protein